MLDSFHIKTIEDVEIKNVRVLLRVDYNVSLTSEHKIANDLRIKQSIPTIKKLLSDSNKIIIISHLGQPDGRDEKYSLAPVLEDLRKLLPGTVINLIDDFRTEKNKVFLDQQQGGEIVLLENIRFYKEEKKNDEDFAEELAALADVYVNDAFGVCHRVDASIVSIPKFIPHFAGLLLAHEITAINTMVNHPKHPLVALVGGAKVSTKINFLKSLIDHVDALIIGGALANTFLCAQGKEIGKSLVELDKITNAKSILEYADEKEKKVLLPKDVVVFNSLTDDSGRVVSVDNVAEHDVICDIGPESEALFDEVIAHAHTIIWNGPFGKVEDERFARGTDFLYYAITQNKEALSLVGGGDTIAAISHHEYLDRITHISAGGGAMMEFIERGTLPGIDALQTE
ncbi:phosphoglycerate kinase [Candidatus Roizmanbacteria bacterium RIFCSPLOWO2_02_FULL_39_8]|nr:MAG: phosphoglycerate kinase [Candidatus Roizmanbacteria bacterium RIFCSPLOWO2_02_FULL_39_8]